MLKNPPGWVDSHDIVVRVNNFKTGAAAGFRTDCFYSFFGKSIRKDNTDPDLASTVLCINKCPDDKFMESAWHEQHKKYNGTDFRYIYEYRKDWWFCPTYVPTTAEFLEKFHLLGGHIPTTGFAALLEVLSLEPANTFVTGMDFFQSGIHNVNERWKKLNHSDPIGHVPDVERDWLFKNAEHLPITMDEMLADALLKKVRPQVPRPSIRRRR